MNTETSLESRVAVLEAHRINMQKQQDASEEAMERLITRIDTLMDKDAEMQINLNRVTDAVTNLSVVMETATDSLKSIADSSTTYQQKLMKYETVAETLMKVGSIIVLIASAGWAIFTFAVENKLFP